MPVIGCELFVLFVLMALGGASVEDKKRIVPSIFYMIHIGEIIREEMKRKERTPAWLAKKINCERPNIYYIFQQESINTELLLKISHALKHDFFMYYSKAASGKE